MEQVIGNNEIYYMFTCPRMFYFYLNEDKESVHVENALENDRIENVKSYFKSISWIDAKKSDEITNRISGHEAGILNPQVSGTILGKKFRISVHALIWKRNKYQIVISHLSRSPGKRHQAIASLFFDLATANGLDVSNNVMFLRRSNLKVKKIKDEDTQLVVDTIGEIENREFPPPASGTRICNFCVYWEKCHTLNVEDRTRLPVGHIRGIGSNMTTMLKDRGIETLGDLIDVPLNDTIEEKIKSIRRYKLQAYSCVNDIALFLSKPEELIQKNEEKGVYFDIEADDTPYLFGFLTNDEYKYFLIDSDSSRNSQISSIMKFVERLQVNLYHYCEYENRILRQLSNELKQQFSNEDKMIDIYEIFVKNIYTPLRHYSLKSIAKWLGFSWRIGLDGRSSIQEYRRWLNTGNIKHLDALLLYNEDDCRATKVVKDWIMYPSSFDHKYLILNRRDVNDILKRK